MSVSGTTRGMCRVSVAFQKVTDFFVQMLDILYEMQLPYEPSCPSVKQLVGLLVGWFVNLSKFPNRTESYTPFLLSEHLF